MVTSTKVEVLRDVPTDTEGNSIGSSVKLTRVRMKEEKRMCTS